MAITATRRDRQRAQTIAEIKAAAWQEMRRSGTTDVSLRAVTRELGMVPSGIYRYYSSREQLLTSLIIDTYDDLSATLRQALDDAIAPPAVAVEELFVVVGLAYRQWALDNLLPYRLVFGNPLQDYQGNSDTTEASRGVTDVLLDIMVRLLQAGVLALDSLDAELDETLRRDFGRWAGVTSHPLPPAALAAAMYCYATLYGAIDTEVNGHQPPALAGNADMFAANLRHSIRSILS